MDDLTSQFGGGLSLGAAEWKPRSAASVGGTAMMGATTMMTTTLSSGSQSLSVAAAAAQSDLNATAVKEFVPGQGWSAAGT